MCLELVVFRLGVQHVIHLISRIPLSSFSSGNTFVFVLIPWGLIYHDDLLSISPAKHKFTGGLEE